MTEQYIHINKDGNKYVYKDSKMLTLHCEDGPAYISKKRVEYYKDGVLHNDKGPAVIADGERYYYINGRELGHQQFIAALIGNKTITLPGGQYTLQQLKDILEDSWNLEL